MKSLKTKIFFIVLSGIIASSVIVGGFGIFWSNSAVKKDSAQILDLMAQVQSEGLNTMFSDVVNSSEVLAHYVSENLEGIDILHRTDEFSRYLTHLEDVFHYVLSCTGAAFSVYVRFAPELTDEVASILWYKKKGIFLKTELPDFPVYTPSFNDSWYYRARASESGIWTNPYYNSDLNEYVISYGLPVYKNGKFIAVVGMDIDFDDIVSVVNSIAVYNTGYAFLTDQDFVIRYNRSIPYGTRLFAHAHDFKLIKNSGIESEFYEYKNTIKDTFNKNKTKTIIYKMVYKDLSNGMRLVVSVPAREIDRTRTRLIISMLIAVIVISVLVSLWNIWMSSRLTKPVKKLADSTRKIIAGDYDFNFNDAPDNEIGELMRTFEFMAKALKRQFEYINGLVYLDSMTGAKNKRAFIDERNEITDKIKKSKDSGEKLEFGVIVFDVNNLKNTNDKYGHKAGDQLIKSACNLIKTVFSMSKIFRIGGDEFVATLTGRDYENRAELLTKLRSEMDCPLSEKNPAFDKVSLAAGLAVYDSSKDDDFQNVFERADEEMYKTKTSMKGGRENIR